MIPPTDGLRPGQRLTIVQWEIVELLDQNLSAAEIAKARHCSPRTIEDTIRTIAGKLSPDLTADLDPIKAIVVWRRWLTWMALPRGFQRSA